MFAGPPPATGSVAPGSVPPLGPAGTPWRWVRAELAAQRRVIGATLLLVYLPAGALLAGVALFAFWRDVPVSLLTSDPATVGRLPFYAGILSNLGVLLWCATAAVTAFAGALLAGAGDRTRGRFFLASAGFTTMLLLDDLLLIHEIVFPYYLGLPQTLLMGAYAGAAVLYLAVFARTIAETEFLLLLAALAALALSVAIDILPPTLPMHLLWEDGAKFLGIAGWWAYFTRTAGRAVERAMG